MALAGKEQGTDVGQWFGPSTAAGAIKFVHFLSHVRLADRPAELLCTLSPRLVSEYPWPPMARCSNRMYFLSHIETLNRQDDTQERDGVNGLYLY